MVQEKRIYSDGPVFRKVWGAVFINLAIARGEEKLHFVGHFLRPLANKFLLHSVSFQLMCSGLFFTYFSKIKHFNTVLFTCFVGKNSQKERKNSRI